MVYDSKVLPRNTFVDSKQFKYLEEDNSFNNINLVKAVSYKLKAVAYLIK